MKENEFGITNKGKIGQFLCRHKNIGSFIKQSKFQNISGETVYHICKNCGKEVGRQFLRYEGMGYK